jgi:hypothetical protein
MRGFNPRMLCLWMSYRRDLMAQSVSVKCKLLLPSHFRPQIDEMLEGLVDADRIWFVDS